MEQWLDLILGSLPPLRPFFAQAVHRISTYKLPIRNHNSGYCLQNGVPNILMQVLAGKQTPEDTNSEENILPGGTGILHTTKLEVLSNLGYSGEYSNEHSTTAQIETTLWTELRWEWPLKQMETIASSWLFLTYGRHTDRVLVGGGGFYKMCAIFIFSRNRFIWSAFTNWLVFDM